MWLQLSHDESIVWMNSECFYMEGAILIDEDNCIQYRYYSWWASVQLKFSVEKGDICWILEVTKMQFHTRWCAIHLTFYCNNWELHNVEVFSGKGSDHTNVCVHSLIWMCSRSIVRWRGSTVVQSTENYLFPFSQSPRTAIFPQHWFPFGTRLK